MLLALIQCNLSAQDSTAVPLPVKKHKFKADPMKATMLAVVFPGFGQIYNRKYWKIPLVYAGFGSLIYAIGFNSSHYITYIEAYQDFTDNNPATNRFLNIPELKALDPKSYDPVLNPNGYATYKDAMLRLVDYYKRYRDLSYIGIGAWYLASIIDANVDASLFNYDVTNNLDVAVAPIQMHSANGMLGAGLNVSFKFNF